MKKAFAVAKTFKPDMLILYIMMPDMDGGEVAGELKGDEESKDIPIVFLTAAVATEQMGIVGTIMGGYPFIAKPVPMELLLDYIKENIG